MSYLSSFIKSEFLNETESHIRMLDKTPDNITYIGSNNGASSCTWEEFRTLADKSYYRGGGEGIVIAKNLIIVFSDFTVMYRSLDKHSLECWDTISVIGKRVLSKPTTDGNFLWQRVV